MKKIIAIALALALVLGVSVTALASTQKYHFDLTTKPYAYTPSTSKADNDQNCYVTTKGSITIGNTTHTSTAKPGDIADFRSMSSPTMEPENYASELLHVSGYSKSHVKYLSGKGIPGNDYYLSARAGKNSKRKSFTIVGQWTP